MPHPRSLSLASLCRCVYVGGSGVVGSLLLQPMWVTITGVSNGAAELGLAGPPHRKGLDASPHESQLLPGDLRCELPNTRTRYASAPPDPLNARGIAEAGATPKRGVPGPLPDNRELRLASAVVDALERIGRE